MLHPGFSLRVALKKCAAFPGVSEHHGLLSVVTLQGALGSPGVLHSPAFIDVVFMYCSQLSFA